jgi:DNA replication and repair protein RecF
MNLVVGANGEGKSNLLEAVTVLGTMRSFRSCGWGAIARHGGGRFGLWGEVESGGVRRALEQRLEVGTPLRRTLRVDGREVGASEYLQWLPVFALSAADSALVAGPPEVRRSFLDRVAFLLRPRHLTALREWRRALRQRNAALQSRSGEAELSSWEESLSRSAGAVVEGRVEALARIGPAFAALYQRLGRSAYPSVELGYGFEGWISGPGGATALAERYRSRLELLRARDLSCGFTSEGPHRHDVGLLAADRPAREVLSAGQVRVVCAALRLAGLEEVERERGEALPAVVDDVDAELDGDSLVRLLEVLGSGRQLLVSSAHEELAGRLAPALTLWLQRGSVLRRTAEGELA